MTAYSETMSERRLSTRQVAYRRLLRNDAWRAFRAEVIEVDGGVCRRCGRSEPDATMHVHHIEYVKGRAPWDYPYASCETLCAGCHAREHGILPPVEGWDFLFETDTGDLASTCEWCGTAIRYTFLIHHPKHEPIEVGCVCCDTLTGTGEASNRQRFIERRDRFASSSRWTRRRGFSFIRQGSMGVEIVPLAEGVKLRIDGVLGSKVYPAEVVARRAAFDVIESGLARSVVTSRRKRDGL